MSGVDGGLSGEHGQLVHQVKQMQRENPEVKDQWVAFTDLHGGGTRDPSKHAPDFLMGFVNHIQGGARLPVHEEIGGALAEMVKKLRKESMNFRNVWAHFCQLNGNGLNDPFKHDGAYHIRFFDYLSHQAYLQLQSTGQMPQGPGDPNQQQQPGMGGPPGKRMRTGGDPAKDNYVQRVKGFQRLGEPQKELWNKYSDLYLGGMRDPGRHDVATLDEFCRNHGVPEMPLDQQQGMDAVDAGMGNAIGGNNIFQQQLQQQAPPPPPALPQGGVFALDQQQAALQPYVSPPVDMSGGFGTGIPAPPPPGMMTPAVPEDVAFKDTLVAQVKNFQRQGDQQKELWSMYADMYLGGIRDPARHDATTLHEFCHNHNVPMVSPDVVQQSLQSGGGKGTHSGIAPMPGGPLDPIKEALVQRVKNFQKGPQEQKDAWNSFAGITLDPARHDAFKLQEFITLYNLP